MRFHASRAARDRFQLDPGHIGADGCVTFGDFHAARQLAERLNRTRDLVRYPERAVRAGQLNAMGLIGEILRIVVEAYEETARPGVVDAALAWLDERLGRESVDATLLEFLDEFPPPAVQRGTMTAADFLSGAALPSPAAGEAPVTSATGRRLEAGRPRRSHVLGEVLQLWLANMNPAQAPFLDLFDDARCERRTVYLELIAQLRAFFATQPVFGPDAEPLVDLLRSPAIAEPHSLPGQLEYIRKRWAHLLGRYYYLLLTALDLIREEERTVAGGPGPARVYEFTGLDVEPERFSPDREWMPRVVMMAKNTYVWLDQLSRRYQREIRRLDQVPDEELDTLAARGMTALWLIGLWERSPASRRIKHLCGNPDAVASAYSLRAYRIADDLGGEAALDNLRDRAARRGVRLASDMVPNHTGIDSEWVIEHPEWFLTLDHSPFPSYSFGGEDLSWEPGVGLYIEDHYYSRDDAAVVFKRVDRRSGEERYIYHGNDGTHMPWNDTAQLDYLRPDAREAVIRTIIDVARRFPIIRFDAAMTLARRHFQRLWYPEPGTGGAIPTRAENGLDRDAFLSRMPEEFWREVVERVAREAPDTLLLAEAFWLMEGYFVRSLGMHRVYNSAFMVMLRDEDNAGYRSVLKNTLAFDPQILKRYVNFMSNPDERTAVDQFGKGDKYFGVCTLLATMPGLPMIAHGQVEGFAEKYGMEYQRARWDETPDPYLVGRHEREIFPLLSDRWRFADVERFRLYDFWTTEQAVNEDVFAYSNDAGGERSLVIYHNRYADTRGWIRQSVPVAVRDGDGRRVEVRVLGDGLRLSREAGRFAIFRDQAQGLEYIRSSAELCDQGLYVELGAYERHVFVDFREVQESAERPYGQLSAFLDGRGAPSIEEAMRELLLQPLHGPYRELVHPGFVRWLVEQRASDAPGAVDAALDDLERRVAVLARAVDAHLGHRDAGDGGAGSGGVRGGGAGDGGARNAAAGAGDRQDTPHDDRATVFARELSRKAAATWHLPRLPGASTIERDLVARLDDDPAAWPTLHGWLVTHALGRLASETDVAERSRSWIDAWLLGRILIRALVDLGLTSAEAGRAVERIKVLTSHQHWHRTPGTGTARVRAILEPIFRDGAAQSLLGVNRHRDVLWFSKEGFEDLVGWLFLVAAIDLAAFERLGAGAAAAAAAAPGKPPATSRWSSPASPARPASSPAPRAAPRAAGTAAPTPASPTATGPGTLASVHATVRELLEVAEAADYQVERLFQ
ncbi:MAG: alpha-amylase family glycosyl hydrolase [Candidatus Eiseniibacteriota bacterium]|jgi:glycosidase